MHSWKDRLYFVEMKMFYQCFPINKYYSTKGWLTLLLGAHEEHAKTAAGSIKKSQNRTFMREPLANKAKMPIWLITKRKLGNFWLEINRISRIERFAATAELLTQKEKANIDIWNLCFSRIRMLKCKTSAWHFLNSPEYHVTQWKYIYTRWISRMLGHQTWASGSFTFHLSSYSLQKNESIPKS